MSDRDQEIQRALVNSILAMNVLVSILKNAGLSTHDIASKHIAENERILADMGVFLTPEKQSAHLLKLNEYQRIAHENRTEGK